MAPDGHHTRDIKLCLTLKAHHAKIVIKIETGLLSYKDVPVLGCTTRCIS